MSGRTIGTYAVIVGGGTAGHVLPGLAIADELVRRGHNADAIHFVGSDRGAETSLVPQAGYNLTTLPGRGIQRRLTTENIGAVRGLAKAFGQARSLLKALDPSGRGFQVQVLLQLSDIKRNRVLSLHFL